MIPVYPMPCDKDGCDKALEKTSAQASTLLEVVSTLLDDLSFTLEAQAKLVASVQRSAQNAVKRRLNVQYDKVTEVTDYLGTLLENRLTEQQVMLNMAAPGISDLTEFGSSESTWQETSSTGGSGQSAGTSVAVQPQTAQQQELGNGNRAGSSNRQESGKASGGGIQGNGQAEQGGTRLQGSDPASQASGRTDESEPSQPPQSQSQAAVTLQPLSPQVQATNCSPVGPLVPVVIMAQLIAQAAEQSIQIDEIDLPSPQPFVPALDDADDDNAYQEL